MASSAVNDALGLRLMASAASEPEPEVVSPSRLQGVPKATTDQANLSATKATGGPGRPRTMKKCAVPGCESFARSRARCKAHGGGKRCKHQGCALSDQGGGFCIRHGGGKRCEVDGCEKSAQSRRFCKAHGGGVRCRVDGCVKTSQGAGCCRAHGGGPRSKSKKGEAAAGGDASSQSPAFQPQVYSKKKLVTTYKDRSSKLSCMVPSRDEKKEMNGSSLAFRIQSVPTPGKVVPSRPGAPEGPQQCCIEGCENAVMTGNARRLCDEHGTNLHFAASLLGMLSTESA
ncbi:hypothetical protein Gpo141_00001029 [Globisporangium polare]